MQSIKKNENVSKCKINTSKVIWSVIINFEMIEITEEMLDIIEAVKGKRNPALWDPRCEQYQRKLTEGTVKKSTTS